MCKCIQRMCPYAYIYMHTHMCNTSLSLYIYIYIIYIYIHTYTYIYIYIYVYTHGARNALESQCAQRDSLSELFLEEKMPYNQCKGKSL